METFGVQILHYPDYQIIQKRTPPKKKKKDLIGKVLPTTSSAYMIGN